MILTPLQLEKLSEKVGQDVTTPAGATMLQLDIETATGVSLGLNTVKRLVGVIPTEVIAPRLTTLNTIANYLGYPDWKAMDKDLNMEGSGFNQNNIFTEMSALPIGTRVEIGWRPDRRLIIRHDGDGIYEVIESRNSKLSPKDILSLSQLAVGFPFVTHDVIRDGKSLGSYQAALDAGITLLTIQKNQ